MTNASDQEQRLARRSDRDREVRRALGDRCRQLEQQLAERTEQLAMEQHGRRTAEHHAEEAIASRSVLLANMSTELRTPLHAIIGYTELLLERLDEPAVRADLDRIHGAARHLLGAVDQVADLSRLDAGTFEIQRAPVDLGTVVHRALEETAALAAHQGNRVVPPSFDPIELFSDGPRIRRILVQLLRNAHRFTRLGVVRLEVLASAGAVDLKVIDSGLGIPPERLEQIFEAFESFDRRAHAGSGLGLAIARRIARLLGGELSASSIPRKGSQFTLSLPVTLPQVRPPTAEEPTEAHPAVMLLIDDDRAARELLRRTFEGIGHIVHEASSGPEGLELARALTPDVVTIDVGSRQAEGRALLKALRADRFDGHVLVISDADDRPLSTTADAFLRKPVTRDELMVTTRQLLDRPRR